MQDIKETLMSLEFEYEKEQRKLFTALSGGMKQKLLIAIALAKQSKLLLFDEPTANLDPKARAQFLNLLTQKAQDKAVIFISHRVDEVRTLTDKIIEMDLGKITQERNND